MGCARSIATVGSALALILLVALARPVPEAARHAGRRVAPVSATLRVRAAPRESPHTDERPAASPREERRRRALGDRSANETCGRPTGRVRCDKDGEVLVASDGAGVAYMNLGSRQGVRAGADFVVWRWRRDGAREDVAVVRVVEVDRTSAEARVVKRFGFGVRVTAGMNVSSPFFDPRRGLRVHVHDDVVRHTDVVAAIEAAGATVVDEVDESVDVFVARAGAPLRALAEPIGALAVPEADVARYFLG